MRTHNCQRYGNDCAIAAIATTLNISLDEAEELMADIRKAPNNWVLHRDMKEKLIKFGYLEPDCKYSTKFDPSKGDAMIYARYKDEPFRHYIPYIGGMFYDPADKEPSSKLNDCLIPSVVYYLNLP